MERAGGVNCKLAGLSKVAAARDYAMPQNVAAAAAPAAATAAG